MGTSSLTWHFGGTVIFISPNGPRSSHWLTPPSTHTLHQDALLLPTASFLSFSNNCKSFCSVPLRVCVCVCFGDIRATCCVMVFSQLCFSSRNWSLNILECLTGSWGDVHCQLQLLMVCLISSWQSSSENNIKHVESELMPITILRINTNNIHFGSCLLSVNIQWSLSVILTLILILYIL